MSVLGIDFSIWDVVEHDFALAKELDLIISTHVWGSPNRLNPDGYKKLAKLLTSAIIWFTAITCPTASSGSSSIPAPRSRSPRKSRFRWVTDSR